MVISRKYIEQDIYYKNSIIIVKYIAL